MLTGKQRSYLRGKGNSLDTVIQVGKEGISKALVAQVNETIEAQELIKVRILDNSLYTAREAAEELAEACEAEVVQVIGSVCLLYKRNQEEPIYKLPN